MASGNTPPILVLKDIGKSRKHEGRSVEVLRNMSLSFAEQRLSLLIGPSGGGKSTLLRLLNRLDDPTSGRITYRGKPLASIPPVTLRQEIAMVMQKPVMFAGTVLDNLRKAFVLRKLPLPDADSPQLLQNLEQCSLDRSMLNRDVQSLSVGQQQRVSLARALITGPRVLLLDEPTSALDRPTGDLLAKTLLRACRDSGVTVIMVSHDLRLAEQIADQLIFIEAGQVLEQGTAQKLLNEPRSEQLQRFLVEPDFSDEKTAETEVTLDRSQPA